MVRAFVRMRELAATHGDLAKRLAELEEKTEALAMSHDTFSRNTRNQLKQVFDALRELMTPPDPPKRPIGFVTQGEKSSHKARRRTRAELHHTDIATPAQGGRLSLSVLGVPTFDHLMGKLEASRRAAQLSQVFQLLLSYRRYRDPLQVG